jgi:hypothetical protein
MVSRGLGVEKLVSIVETAFFAGFYHLDTASAIDQARIGSGQHFACVELRMHAPCQAPTLPAIMVSGLWQVRPPSVLMSTLRQSDPHGSAEQGFHGTAALT